MTTTPPIPPDPPHLDLIACLDCSSSTEVEHVEAEVRVWLRHSETCHVWRHPARQLALLVYPAAEDNAADVEVQA